MSTQQNKQKHYTGTLRNYQSNTFFLVISMQQNTVMDGMVMKTGVM